MSERGFVASFQYALNGVDLVAPVWHVSLLGLLLDDDLDLVPLVDPRLRIVALSDAFQLRLHLRLVLFLPRVVRRHQRAAVYVFLAVVLLPRHLRPPTTSCPCRVWR